MQTQPNCADTGQSRRQVCSPVLHVPFDADCRVGILLLHDSGHNGAIFSIKTDGSGFGLCYSFAAGSTDGGQPNGNLTRTGSTVYGMTAEGGDAGGGVIFRLY
ncbi:MAG: hypothetical protein AB9866_17675 [Syntrophobacteraceae bacterium]